MTEPTPHVYRWTGRSPDTCAVTADDGQSWWCGRPQADPIHVPDERGPNLTEIYKSLLVAEAGLERAEKHAFWGDYKYKDRISNLLMAVSVIREDIERETNALDRR